MQAVPVTTYVGEKPSKPEAKPGKVVKMIRIRDLIIAGAAWSLVCLVMLLTGSENVDWNDVATPIYFALALVLFDEKHDVKL